MQKKPPRLNSTYAIMSIRYLSIAYYHVPRNNATDLGNEWKRSRLNSKKYKQVPENDARVER